ncbi:MAG: hypothetical protein D6723_11370 [Acidobacteria bacterium]|nr:MAG: hypothetical protein D6723_11370 [Acidobacteriota bacterium]
MDADRLFFRVNALMSSYVGFTLLARAIDRWRGGFVFQQAAQDLDKYFDLVLRYFAEQSFYFAVFAGYIPALMLISLVVSFYLYLHERSRSISLIAFVFGTALGALWITRRLFGTAMTALAARYIEADTIVARQHLFDQVKGLYYYDSLGNLLSGQTSLIAYSLFGLLFLRGKGLEFIVGVLFLGSSLAIVIAEIVVPGSWRLETAGIMLLPAVAFILSSILLWNFKPSVEVWAQAPRGPLG